MNRRLWLAVLILASLALWTARTFYQFGGFNDDAAYVVGAKRMVETGRLLTVQAQDGGSAAYFPGYSLLLIPPLLAGGGAYEPLQFYSLLWTLTGATFLMLLARRRLSTPTAMLLGALYVFTPAGLTYGTTVMSDIPFSALFLLALWWGEADLASGRQRWHWFGLLVSLVMEIRLPGVALVVAFGLALLLRKAWRSLGLFALGCCAGGLYTLLGILLKSGAGNYVNVASVNYAHNSVLKQQWVFWTQLPGYLASNYLGWPGWPLVIVVLVLGLVTIVKRRADPVSVAWLAYVGACSLWPFIEARYWLFAWPLLLLLACERLSGKAAPVLLALLLLAAIPRELAMIEIGGRNQVAWDERRAAYAWIRENTREGDILAGVMTTTLEYYTGRRTWPPGRSTFWSEFLVLPISLGVDYLVIEPDDTVITMQGVKLTNTPAHVEKWAEASPLLEKVHDSRRVKIYRLKPEAWKYEMAYRMWSVGFNATDPASQERYFRRALELSPGYDDAAKSLAKVYLADPSRAPEGLRLLREVTVRTPIDLNAGFELATALQKRGDAAGARAEAERLKKIAESLGISTRELDRFLQ